MKYALKICCVLLSVLFLMPIVLVPLPSSGEWGYMQTDEVTPEGLELGLGNNGYWVTGLDTDVFSGGKLVIPAVYKGKSVVGIDGYSFYAVENLTEVVLPESIYAIGSGAFLGCSSLEKVNLPTSLVTLDYDAFGGCSSLKSLHLPKNLVNLGNWVFDGCRNLTLTVDGENAHFEIRSGCLLDKERQVVRYLLSADGVPPEGYAPSGYMMAMIPYDAIEEYTFPEGTKTIPNQFLAGFYNLKKVTIPDTVTKIEAGAFMGCSSLEEITIPNSVSEIKYGVFSDCTSLKRVTLPASLSELNISAFWGCGALEEILMPKNVSKFVPSALDVTVTDKMKFRENSYLSVEKNCLLNSYWSAITPVWILLAEGDPFLNEQEKGYVLREQAFANYKGSREELTLPENLTFFISGFEGAPFKKIILHDKVTEIPSRSFYNSEIESIRVPGSVKEIGENAFSGCDALETVILEEGINTIGRSAFWGCDRLTEIYLPDSVGVIETNAFEHCDQLKDVRFGSGLRSIGSSFGYTALEKVELPEGLESIGAYAFLSCKKLTAVYLPESLKSLAPSMLALSPNVEILEVAEGNEYYYSVDGCVIERATGQLVAASKNAVIPDDGSVKSIAKGAFRGYGGSEIRIPEGITELADELFSECAFLERVYLPMSLEGINGSVFSGCRSLKEILVAEDHPLFRNYKGNLVEKESGILVCGGSNAVIEDDSGITAIGNGAYSGRSVLKYAYIGSSVKRIGGAAFAGCSNLTRVDFAEGLEAIEGIAFIQSGIQWAKLPESIKSLAEGSFGECEDLRWIYVPRGLDDVGEDCLWAKDALYYGGTREEWLKLTASIFRPENVQFCATPPRTGDGTPLLFLAAGTSGLLALALLVLQKRKKKVL